MTRSGLGRQPALFDLETDDPGRSRRGGVWEKLESGRPSQEYSRRHAIQTSRRLD